MNQETNRNTVQSLIMALFFIPWTFALGTLDVKAVGPQGSSVGLSSLNLTVHKLFGFNNLLYKLTDFLSLIPLLIVVIYAFLGLSQLFKRKSIFKVDSDILIFGVYLIVVLSVFALFEIVIINYRPILINGHLEASYPSSTTMLMLSVIPPIQMLNKSRIRKLKSQKFTSAFLQLFMISMVLARIVSGVHWITNFVGGILLSSSLVKGFKAVLNNLKY